MAVSDDDNGDSDDTYDLAPASPPPPRPAPPSHAPSAVLPTGVAPPPPPPPLPRSAPGTPVSLQYVRAKSLPGRPAVLTVIAILGIMAGLLSLLASGAVAWFWGLAWVRSRPLPPPPPGDPLPPASVQAYAGETVGPRGLPRATRAKLLNAFPLNGPFAADRRAMLDRLLAESGQDIVPAGNVQILATAREKEGRRIPTETPWARELFVLPAGRVIVGNTSCTYRAGTMPTGASSLAKIQPRDFEPQPEQPTDVSVRGSVVFTLQKPRAAVVAIDEVIAELQRARQLTPLQLGYVAHELVQLPTPDARQSDAFRLPVWPEAATVDARGMLTVPIGSEVHYVLADGRGISSRAAPQGVDSESGRRIPKPPPPNKPMLAGDHRLMLALSIHSAASLALAVLLISASIRMLMNSPRAPTWLAGWAYAKLLLIVLEIVLSASFISSVSSSTGGSATGYDVGRGTFSVVITVIVQVILPIMVLVTLFRSESVSEFLASRGAAPHGPASWFAHSPAWAARVGLLVLILLILGHAIAAWDKLRGGYGSGGLGVGFIFSIVMSALALLGGLLAAAWFARRVRGAVTVVAFLTIAMLAAASTGAAPAPPTGAEAAARVQELSGQMQPLTPRDPQYMKAFEELTRLGEPAMDVVFDQTFKFAYPAMIDVLVREWTAQKLIAKPGPRKKLRDVAPRLVGHWPDGTGTRLLALLGKDPTLVPLLVQHCFTPFEEHRRTYINAVLANDPKATALIAEAVKRAAKVDQDGGNAMVVLNDLGALGRPAKLKLTQSPSGEVRAEALRHLIPADDTYVPEVVARALELLNDPVQGIKPVDNPQSSRRPEEVAQSIQASAVAVLAASGVDGRRKLLAMLDDASPTAVSPEMRQRVMSALARQIKEMENLRVAWHYVTPKQWPAVHRVARLYVERSPAAADDVLKLLASGDKFERQLGVDTVVAAADMGLLTDAHFDRAIAAMGNGGNPELRDLLFKAVSQSPKLSGLAGARKLAAEVIKGGTFDPSYRPALQMLAKGGPAGREVLYAALAGNTIQKPPDVIDALVGSGSALTFTFPVSQLAGDARNPRAAPPAEWQRPGYRAAVVQLIRTADGAPPLPARQEDHEAYFNDFKRKLVTNLMAWLTKGNPDEQLVAARSLRLSDEYAQQVGPDTRRRINTLIGPAQDLTRPPTDPSQAAAFRTQAIERAGWISPSLAWLATVVLFPAVIWLATCIRAAEGAEE